MPNVLDDFERHNPLPWYTRTWEIADRTVTAVIEWKGNAWEWRTSVYRRQGAGVSCYAGSSNRRRTPEEAAYEANEWVKANVKEKVKHGN